MDQHTLSILLRAKDEASRVLQSAGREIANMERQARSSAGGFGVLERAMGGLNRVAQGLGSTMKSVFTGVAMGAGISAWQSGLRMVGAAMDFVGGAAIGLNDRLEQARIGFSTMLGGAQQADGFLRQLAAFAAKTPFEFPELVQATQRMLAMGFAAKDLIPMLTNVGNAAAAMGTGESGINRIVIALGQMQARTKVAFGEMNQLSEAGIPAWQILADAVGMSVAQIQADVEKGKISAKTFIDAFNAFAENNYGGMMEAQSHTFSGAMSTIRDSLQMAVADGAKPFFEWLTRMADRMSQFVQGRQFQLLSVEIQNAVSSMIPQLEQLGDRFFSWATGDGPGQIKALAEDLKRFAGIVEAVAGQAVEFGHDIGTMVQSVKDFKAAIDELRADPGGSAKRGAKSAFMLLFGIEQSVLDDAVKKVRELAGLGGEGNKVPSGSEFDQFVESMANVTWTAQQAAIASRDYDLAQRQAANAAMEMVAAQQRLLEQNTVGMIQETSAELAKLIAFEAATAEAIQATQAAMDQLSGSYQVNLSVQQSLSTAIGEYKGQITAIEEAQAILNQRKSEGTPLTQQEAQFLDLAGGAIERYTGGIEDNTVQKGFAAVANAELMVAQDALNAMLRQGVTDGDALAAAEGRVQEALQNAKAMGLDPATEAGGAMSEAMSRLQGVISSVLVPAIDNLISALGRIKPPPEVTITVDNAQAMDAINSVLGGLNSIPLSKSVQVYVNSTMNLPQDYAVGGPVRRGGIARINEYGPELIRFPYMGEFGPGGTVGGSFGFANRGKSGYAYLPAGAEIIPAPQSREIIEANRAANRARLGGLPSIEGNWTANRERMFPDPTETQAAAEAIEAMARAFNSFLAALERMQTDTFANLDRLADPDYMDRLAQNVEQAQAAFDAAVASGADQSIIDELARQSTLAQEQWRLAGELSGTAYVQGLKDKIASEEAAKEAEKAAEKAAKEAEEAAKRAAQALADSWMTTLGNLDDIYSGEEGERLREQIADLEKQIQVGLAGGAPEEVIARLQTMLDEIRAQLARAEAIAGPAIVSPWVVSGGGGSNGLSGFPGVIGSNVTGGGDIRLMQEGAKFGRLQDFGPMTDAQLAAAPLGMAGLNAYADGGWVTEPVAGVGLRSGRPYTFAEDDAELVLNKGQVGALGGNSYFQVIIGDEEMTDVALKRISRMGRSRIMPGGRRLR